MRFFLRAQTRRDFGDPLQVFLFCLSEAANLILLRLLEHFGLSLKLPGFRGLLLYSCFRQSASLFQSRRFGLRGLHSPELVFCGSLLRFDLSVQLVFFFGAFAGCGFRVMTCFQLLEDASLDFLDPSKFVFLDLAQAFNLGGEPLFPLCPLLFFGSSLTTSFFQRAQADLSVRNRIQMLLFRYAKGLDMGVELLLFADALLSSSFCLPANRFQFSQALLFS